MSLDERVRQLLASGDVDAAATEALGALGPGVLGYLRSLHGDDEGDDVFQQWAEDLWRGISGFRGEGALRTWAYRLAWHASVRCRRQPWKRRKVRLRTSAASRLARSVTASTPLGGRDERLEILRKELDPEDRTLLVLRLSLAMTWEEASAVLAREGSPATPETLRKRFQRLKDKLGRLAREKGLVEG